MQRTATCLWQQIMLYYSPVHIKFSVYNDCAHSRHSGGDDLSFIEKSGKHSVFVKKTLYHKELTMYPGIHRWYLINLCGKCGLSGLAWGFLNDGFSSLDAWKAVVDVKAPLAHIQCWSISHSAALGLPPPISINPAQVNTVSGLMHLHSVPIGPHRPEKERKRQFSYITKSERSHSGQVH